MDIYYSTAKLIIRVYQLILPQDCRVNGEISPAGAKILAANHENATDGFFLPFLFEEKLYYFMQWDLFLIPFLGWLLKKAKQIDVQRGQKNKSLEQAAELLADGKTVVIFPEGQLNPDHRPVKAGTGAVRLSLMTGAPIIPVGFFVPKQHVHCFEIKKKTHPARAAGRSAGIVISSSAAPGNQDHQWTISVNYLQYES